MTKGVMTKFRIGELSAVDVPCQEGALAVIMKRGGDPAEQGKQGESEMSTAAIAKALGLEDSASVEAITAGIAKIAADAKAAADKADDLAKRATLTDSSRSHLETLEKMDGAKAKAFLAMTEEDRQKEVKKSLDGDEAVELEGRTIRKSAVGEDTFAILKAQSKRLDDQAAEIAKAKYASELASFEKRAKDDYSHLVGTDADKAGILKHMASAPEEVRKNFDALMKAAEGATKAAFSKRGFNSDLNPDAGDANAELKKRADEYAKKEGVPFAKAYDAVLQTPEGAELYEKTLNKAQGDDD